jgi:thymidine kinase
MQRSLESGYLKMTMGPMFSGKTIGLIAQITRYRDLGCKCLIINHSLDVRETSGTCKNLTFHSGASITIPDDITVISTNDLCNVDVTCYKCIAIDEIQFFPSVVIINEWVDVYGCHVFVSGLNGSSERTPFGHTLDLIPHCDDISIIKACCLTCLKNNGSLTDAIFTQCKIVKESEVRIGGSDIYQPTCRRCYNR